MTNVEKLWVADTNILLDNLQQVVQTKKIVLMSSTRREMDKHKIANDENLRYKARRANRFIFENIEKFVLDSGDYNAPEILGSDYTNDFMDNTILACCVSKGYSLLTNDLNLYVSAKAHNVDVETFDEGKKNDESYTGIHKVYISNEDTDLQDMFSRIYQNSNDNAFNLLANQYLIVYDKDKPIEFNESGEPIRFVVLDKFRFDGTNHVKLKLPDKKVYKPQNEEQECAADMLLNSDVPIKIIAGTYGSGKTMAAVKIALHHVLDKGNHAKLMVVRNPIGSGESVGWLKGSLEDKTDGFFKPIIQHLEGGEQEAMVLETRGQLSKNIPYYMKGLSIEDTFVIVDEAEDLDTKLFKLVGTRLAKRSAIAFTGDFNQAEDKYKGSNGLIRAIETLKGDPLVGIVILEEDVRSEASKVFSKM